MSKSLGNFFTIREVLKKYDPEVIRYFILTSHYRSPLNYSDQHLDNAKAALTGLYTALRGLELPVADEAIGDYAARFFIALDDDFATPEALSVLFDLAREVNRLRAAEDETAPVHAALLRHLAGLLGLLQREPEAFLQGGDDEGLSAEAIEALIQQRLDARKNKDWALADKIRDDLKAQGVVLEDGAGTTTWRRE